MFTCVESWVLMRCCSLQRWRIKHGTIQLQQEHPSVFCHNNTVFAHAGRPCHGCAAKRKRPSSFLCSGLCQSLISPCAETLTSGETTLFVAAAAQWSPQQSQTGMIQETHQDCSVATKYASLLSCHPCATRRGMQDPCSAWSLS